MNRATLARLEKALNPPEDGTVRVLVGMQESPEGYRCEACGKIHPTFADAEAAHAGPGVLLLIERIVGADKQPLSGTSPG